MTQISLVLSIALAYIIVRVSKSKLESTGNSDWYYNYWCGGSLQYLDDSECVKLFPISFDREWQCPLPVVDSSTIPEGYQPEGPLTNITVDVTSLNEIITDTDINICIISTRRVIAPQTSKGFTLYNKYYCTGNSSASNSFETWSSSKIFAMANAAGHLRINETMCRQNMTGLDWSTIGKQGDTQLGDLATIICSYDSTAGYTSNSLSSYFHDLGWRSRLAGLVTGDWLQAANQSLGGNYGEATPLDLSFMLHGPCDSEGYQLNRTHLRFQNDCTCNANIDPNSQVYENKISALSSVEMTRRLVLHREVDSSMQFPGSTWADIQTILYGASNSSFFTSEDWGGMTVDTSVFLQTALNFSKNGREFELSTGSTRLKETLGLWRIFSKLGAGYSTSRGRGEIVSNAYACVPRYSLDNSEPATAKDQTARANNVGVSQGGLEFMITVRGSVVNDYDLTLVEAKVLNAYNLAVAFIVANESM